MNQFKDHIVSRDLNKSAYLSQRKEKMNDAKNIRKDIVIQNSNQPSIKQKMLDFNLTMQSLSFEYMDQGKKAQKNSILKEFQQKSKYINPTIEEV